MGDDKAVKGGRPYHNEASRAVMRVGAGRGFVVETVSKGPVVITASHCLPHLPSALGGISHSWERCYPALLSRLGEDLSAMAECLFVDPVADIAVLGSPDDQTFPGDSIAYYALVGACAVLSAGETAADGFGFGYEAPGQQVWLLGLDGSWFQCEIGGCNGTLWLSKAMNGIRGGMSGSPILDVYGSAVGVVCCAGGSGTDTDKYTEGGPNPPLSHTLPGWLLRETGIGMKRRKRNKRKSEWTTG